MATEQFANNATSTLNGAISSGATTLLVSSATSFPAAAQFRIIIDSEIMLVTGVSGTTFTVTRGAENTTATSHSNGASVNMILTAGALDQMRSDLMSLSEIGHRLTLTSATPITTSNVTGATTIYLTPYKSTRIALYNGTLWRQYSANEITLNLSGLTNGSLYDVFAYDNAGIVALELSAAWASSTSRTDALTQQDGVLVKASDSTRRYLGTFAATGTNTAEDSDTNRYLWNHYNRTMRPARGYLTSDQSTSSNSYSTLLTVNYVIGQGIFLYHSYSASLNKTSNIGTIFMRLTIDGVAEPNGSALSATSGFNGVISYQRPIAPGIGKHAITMDWKVDTNGAALSGSSSPTSQHASLDVLVEG